MKFKILLALLVSFITLQVAIAQTNGDRVSTTEIISLVTDAVSKHNTIYNDRIKGHESEQADLRKAIYSANTELIEIRTLLAGNQMLKGDQYAKLQKPMAELQSAIEAVEQSSTVGVQSRTTDADIQKAVSNVCSKAKVLKMMIQKIKK